MESQSRSTLRKSGKQLSRAWLPFTVKLTEILERLAEDQYLVVTAKRSNRYVQFAGQGAFGLRAEATSNHYLAAGDRLSRRQVAALKACGWLLPSGSAKSSTPDKDPDGSPNYYFDFESPIPFESVAELAVETLSKIFEINHPGELDYQAFNADGDAIHFHELGLMRAQEKVSNASRDMLQSRLQNVLRSVTGIDDLVPDADCDFVVNYGALEIWTVILGNPPWVRICAMIVQDAVESPALLAKLNSINDGVHRLRFFLHGGSVCAVSEVPANPLVESHLSAVLGEFGEVAGSLAVLLQAEFSRDSVSD